ncbi:IS630 transposase-related protein [Legionella brunensis]|nr:IS630 transposase-related protein [Legionella brunensis]
MLIRFSQKSIKDKSRRRIKLEAVSIRFGVGKASVMRWLIDLKRNKPATKIDMGALKRDVAYYPDSYQYERAARFNVSKTGIRSALIRLKLSYKKNME